MRTRILCVISALFFLLCSCRFSPSENNNPSSVLKDGEALFCFIDVGQGDSSLIRTKDAVILIDTGTSGGGTEVYNFLEKNNIKYIDCLILTHPHEDHMGGASKIFSGIKVGDVYINGESSSGYAFEELIDILTKKNITPIIPEAGSEYSYGSIDLKFISPSHIYDDENDNSLVTMVTHKNVKALFTGDAETVVESDMMANYDLKADILKVAHHGSRNASSLSFLKKVSPGVAVIQCGKDNSYGHPHDETLQRLEKIGTRVMRNDVSGTIILHSDGNTVTDDEGNEFPKIHTESENSTYIANVKSKVFHTGDCPNLPNEKNRIVLTNRKQAEDEGYKPCGNCNP